MSEAVLQEIVGRLGLILMLIACVVLIFQGLITAYVAPFFQARNTSVSAAVGAELLNYIFNIAVAFVFIFIIGYTVEQASSSFVVYALSFTLGVLAFSLGLKVDFINALYIRLCSGLLQAIVIGFVLVAWLWMDPSLGLAPSTSAKDKNQADINVLHSNESVIED